MITTASKFFYAVAGLLLLTGVVYGYTTGGGEVGPLSLGYKGAVGDLLGYSILMGSAAVSAFIGFAVTAFRDGDPEAGADLLAQPVHPLGHDAGEVALPGRENFGHGLHAAAELGLLPVHLGDLVVHLAGALSCHRCFDFAPARRAPGREQCQHQQEERQPGEAEGGLGPAHGAFQQDEGDLVHAASLHHPGRKSRT